MFFQGRGFERGNGRKFVILLMAIFNIHFIDIFTTYGHFTRRGTLGLRPFIYTIFTHACDLEVKVTDLDIVIYDFHVPMTIVRGY